MDVHPTKNGIFIGNLTHPHLKEMVTIVAGCSDLGAVFFEAAAARN